MPKTLELFKDLPQPVKAATAPRKVPTPRSNPEQPIEDPKEFPLGEDPDNIPPVIEPPIAPIEPPPELRDVDFEENEDDENPPTASNAAGRMNEMEMLKQRALLMGIKFSNNIGLDALRSKVQARLEDNKDQRDQDSNPVEEKQPSQAVVKTERQIMYESEMRLVRLRITNLDPKKKDLPGEIFTVANEFLGAVKKFIPYGEATDNGYHVPYIIYRQLREREFLNIKTRKDRQGRTIVETSMAREFALEELPPLTQKELDRLAASQAASAGMSS